MNRAPSARMRRQCIPSRTLAIAGAMDITAFAKNSRKPSWSSSFIIAAINNCKRFSPLRFKQAGAGDSLTCQAWANDLQTGDVLTGPTITMEMAKKEGWVSKSGSKWQTMPELMIMYRSAAFFGRLYAPDILMGMHTVDEVNDNENGRIVSGGESKKEALKEKQSNGTTQKLTLL